MTRSQHILSDPYLDAFSDLGNGDHYWRGDCSCGWTVHRVFRSSILPTWQEHAEENGWYDTE